jgi:hypothetical protein
MGRRPRPVGRGEYPAQVPHAVKAAGGREVLQPKMPVVAGVAETADRPEPVDAAGPWLVAPIGVGDLHMADQPAGQAHLACGFLAVHR